MVSDYQFGFKRRHSAIDAVLAIIKLVANSLNNKEKCVVVSLDLKKAFDTISHMILLLKLKKIGRDFKALKWFYSFLENRLQFVCFNKKISLPKILKIGTIQGSVLSPLLHIY